MKKVVVLAVCFAFLSNLTAQELKTYNDSLSYAVGLLWGQNIRQQGLNEVKVAPLSQAIADVLADAETKMDIKTSNDFVRAHLMKKKDEEKLTNMAAGRVFLETNAKRTGVVTLPSGLQYEVLSKGTGEIPTANDKVTVHYHGTLISGDVFDSSLQRGEPATFPVTGVIKGWVEALQLMPVGSKWKLFIPADLAYGDRGAGGMIGPGAALIFEVELLAIVK